MNVVLIGYRCSGKTTVGAILAKKLNRTFIDSDNYLEKKFNTTISTIFKTRGEPYFRMLEGDVIRELSKLDNIIIATGGGAVLRYKNIRNLKQNGIIIFLDVGSQNAYRRLLKDKTGNIRRPNLTDKDLRTEVREHIAFRHSYYKAASDNTIKTDNKSIGSIVKKVLGILEKHNAKDKTKHNF